MHQFLFPFTEVVESSPTLDLVRDTFCLEHEAYVGMTEDGGEFFTLANRRPDGDLPSQIYLIRAKEDTDEPDKEIVTGLWAFSDGYEGLHPLDFHPYE